MPNGVICGGADDGSNQLGAMVTCQAMTARPDGVACSAAIAVAAKPYSSPRNTTTRRICSDFIYPSPIFRDRSRNGLLVLGPNFHCRAAVRTRRSATARRNREQVG